MSRRPELKHYIPEEVKTLINSIPILTREKPSKKEHHKTYSLEEVAALITGDYHPDKFKYRHK